MAEKRNDNRGAVQWLWYFRTYAEQLARSPHSVRLDPDRLVRFYLDGCLDSAIMWDFHDWLKHNAYDSKGGK